MASESGLAPPILGFTAPSAQESQPTFDPQDTFSSPPRSSGGEVSMAGLLNNTTDSQNVQRDLGVAGFDGDRNLAVASNNIPTTDMPQPHANNNALGIDTASNDVKPDSASKPPSYSETPARLATSSNPTQSSPSSQNPGFAPIEKTTSRGRAAGYLSRKRGLSGGSASRSARNVGGAEDSGAVSDTEGASPGMKPVPLRRISSNKPPAVCPFGSVTPDDEEDNLGFRPVRSREEALARDDRRNRLRGYSDASQTTQPTGIATPINEGLNEDSVPLRSVRENSGEAESHEVATGAGASDSDETVAANEENAGVGMMGGEGGGGKFAKAEARGGVGGIGSGAGVDLEKGGLSVPNTAPKDETMRKGEDWMVKFDPGEKANPKNWGVAYRWYLTFAGGLLVLNSTFSSSAPSGIVFAVEEHFGFSQEVATLMISLFVAGYCVGPLLWGPLSESFGRRPIFLIAFLGYTGFQVGCALAPNTASILIFRLLGGLFASCPLTNAGGLLADIWDADRRGQAMAFFALAPFAGPALGPIVGGAIDVTGTNWRWLFWVLTLFAGFCGLLVLFTLPETYTPILLVKKAKRLRKETGQQEWYAPLERAEKGAKDIVRDVLVKPFKILALEPMLQAITVYMSFVYGCIYLLFEAYPVVFIEIHGFNSLENGLTFLGLFTGGVLATILYLAVFAPRYKKKAKKYAEQHGPGPTPPEVRLEPCLIAAPLLMCSFFWFGWTSYPSISWASPCVAGGLLGFSVLPIFVSLFNYIVDTYLWAAASALSANTVCRSVFGAVFPLFASQMYDALNPRWASSLLGFVALVMVPIPAVLIKFGPRLRARSKFSPTKK